MLPVSDSNESLTETQQLVGLLFSSRFSLAIIGCLLLGISCFRAQAHLVNTAV
jgi:hypothetical protein